MRILLAISAAAMLLGAGGCASSEKESESMADQALNDPFNYKPTGRDDWPDVSGGGIHQFDKKGFKRDLNNVLNP